MNHSPQPQPQEEIYSVNPARLQHGTWCHRTNKNLAEGDIAASYSADRIADGEPIRKPFAFKEALCVCIGSTPSGAEAYLLIPLELFPYPTFTYADKVGDSDAARRDPYGFYHGIVVRYQRNDFVLCGPPVWFVASSVEPPPLIQLDLFGGAL